MPYLNNVLEQDHRAIKRRINASQHFRSFWCAWRTIAGCRGRTRLFSPFCEGFPEFSTFLVVVAFVPAVGFFPTARRFITWRAFSLALFFINFGTGYFCPNPRKRKISQR